MKNELRQLCKSLKLGYLMDHYEDIEFQNKTQYILEVLRKEKEERERRKIQRLMKKAGFNQLKTLADYDFQAISLPKSISLTELTNLTFLDRKENVIMLGAVGTGKTHLATALVVEACKQGRNARFFRVAELVATLQSKHRNGTLPRFMHQLSKCELLVLDELGFIPLHKDGAELLFNVISDCYERNSVIVTSNLTFGEWTTVFGDSRLTAAIIDRLVHHAHILTFTGESYRLINALSGTLA